MLGFPVEQTTNEMCFGFIDAVTDIGGTLDVRLFPNGFIIPRLDVLPKVW